MARDGSPLACRAGIIAFALVFLFSVFLGAGVAGACLKGTVAALAVFVSAKVIQYLLMRAVVDELTEFVRKESARKKSTVE